VGFFACVGWLDLRRRSSVAFPLCSQCVLKACEPAAGVFFCLSFFVHRGIRTKVPSGCRPLCPLPVGR